MILPVQDVFGWQARINQPATSATRTGPGSCRGQAIGCCPSVRLLEAAEFLRQTAARYGRTHSTTPATNGTAWAQPVPSICLCR